MRLVNNNTRMTLGMMNCIKGLILMVNIVVGCLFGMVRGHGRLVDPPSRSSMWRYGFSNPPNYNDNQLYCGGVQIQYEVNKGHCGVCGDPFQGPHDNEPDGKYANGIIVRSMEIGSTMPVTVDITASHKGYMEFRLCPNDDPKKRITQECLDDYLLPIVETKDTKYPVTKAGKYNVKVLLPENVKCRNCVFQWKYNTGNSWGVDPVTKQGCVGCGNQEQFYGCADIAIGYPDLKEGISLITNQMSKGGPIVQPGIPTPPLIPPELDNWDTSTSKEENDKSSKIESEQEDRDFTYEVYRNFLNFQKQFQNKHVRPCVCHSCVGSTCVCECLDGNNSASVLTTSSLQSYLLLSLAILTYIIQNGF